MRANNRYRVEGVVTTRWYPSRQMAWDHYVRSSQRNGVPDPWHMPGSVAGDVREPDGSAIHGVRDGHTTVTLRRGRI